MNVYIRPDTTPWTNQQFQNALQELIQYDWDIRGLHILYLYKDDEIMLFHTLHKFKFKLEQEKTARLQKKFIETAKKHNVESLKIQMTL